AEQGQVAEGIAQMQQGQAAFRAMGTKLYPTIQLADLATAYAKVGQTEEGLTLLAKALTSVDKPGGQHYGAELYRLKGELSLQSRQAKASQDKSEASRSRVGIAYRDVTIAEAGTVGGAHPTGEDEAEVWFLKAIEIARKQQAKSLELRAVMSLSRLWQRQGK